MVDDFAPCAEISLDNLLHNVKQIRSRISPPAGIIAVVKDSGYGCGTFAASRLLQEEAGISFFAVATLAEARALRKNGITGKILVLGRTPIQDLAAGDLHKIHFNCTGPDDLVLWSKLDHPVNFHVEIDTGMTRLGLRPEDLPLLVTTIKEHRNLFLKGIFTHMASADEPGTPTVDRQIQLFSDAINTLKEAGINPETIHAANSATILRFPAHTFTHVRPGIALYGCKPDPSQDFNTDLRPVLSLYGRVISLRTVPAGTPVSYGGHYVTPCSTSIATIGIGYANGVPRYLSNRGGLIIKGKRYAIAGNVTMDYIMADIGSSSDIDIGDKAFVIGSQGSTSITPDDIALLGNTIGYEVLSNISGSVRHVYTRNDREIDRCEHHPF